MDPKSSFGSPGGEWFSKSDDMIGLEKLTALLTLSSSANFSLP
jgi:hypothetical protein